MRSPTPAVRAGQRGWCIFVEDLIVDRIGIRVRDGFAMRGVIYILTPL
jgi:hypothetical protein